MGRKRKSQPAEPFAKLGDVDFQEKKKLRYVPEWIEKATLVSCDIQSDKTSIDSSSDILSQPILDQLRRRGFTHLFPVQSLLIPELLSPFLSPITASLPPRDICVSAPTGSGKTLAYVLPILEVLQKSTWLQSSTPRHRIRALVILPVVDLAKQVYEVFRSFLGDSTSLKIALLTGQQELDADIRNVYEDTGDGRTLATVDIVVATPGRLLEHLNESGGAFCLHYLRFLVIDEADRLLSDYRMDWFKAMEQAVYGDQDETSKKMVWFFGERRMPNQRPSPVRRYRPNVGSINALFDAGRYPLQKVFLSATLSYDPGQLQRLNLFRPKLFKAQRHADETESELVDDSMMDRVVLPSELKEYYLTCSSKMKPLAMFCSLNEHDSDWRRVLCFVQSRQTSQRLANLLVALGLENVKEASAGLTRIRRQHLLKKLTNGKIRVLVCSDLFARGIDIPEIDCVINYDAPKQILAYVHRAGRTARAGCSGSVMTITDESEIKTFRSLMESNGRWSVLTRLELADERFKELKPKYKEALAQLKNIVVTQQRNSKLRRKRKKPKEVAGKNNE